MKRWAISASDRTTGHGYSGQIGRLGWRLMVMRHHYAVAPDRLVWQPTITWDRKK